MESTKDNKRELLPVCPICNQFPLVTANIDEPGYINIKCNCGYEREKTSLKDYVSSILNNPKIEKEKIKRQCEEHKQPFKSYSPFFDQQLCNECNTSSIYLNDPQISLETDKLFIDRKIQKFQDNINRARTLFETNITKLKNRYIAKLVKEINAVNAAYDEARDNNFIFLDLCESLIKNYSSEQPNYYLNKSIVSNYFDFTYKDFTSEWNTESVIKYFKTLFFLDTKITYDKIKEEKTINVDNVNCLLLLKDGRIASCSGDKMIRIFNRKTYQCEETLEGHTNAVYSISQFDNGDDAKKDDKKGKDDKKNKEKEKPKEEEEKEKPKEEEEKEKPKEEEKKEKPKEEEKKEKPKEEEKKEKKKEEEEEEEDMGFGGLF